MHPSSDNVVKDRIGAPQQLAKRCSGTIILDESVAWITGSGHQLRATVPVRKLHPHTRELYITMLILPL